MDSYWQMESLHAGMDDPLEAFLFDPAPAVLPGEFPFAEMAPCFPDMKQEQFITEGNAASEHKPAIVEKKSSRGPSIALHSANVPLPATRPARASKPTAQRQQTAASKLPKGGPAPQPAQQQQQQQQQQQGNSGSADDTDYMSEEVEEASTGKGSKRSRAPEVDWKAIQDPEERRRQRRLAKNRLTAARSRERKKAILSELETKLQGFEAENTRLQAMLATMGKENKDLKQQLGQLCPGGMSASAAAAAAAAAGGAAPNNTADADRSTKGPRSSKLPAASVKVLLALLLCMCLAKLTGEQLGLVLGGALPLLALVQLMESEGWGVTAGVSESHGGRNKRRRTSTSSASSNTNSDTAAHSSATRTAAALAKHHGKRDESSQVFAGLAHFLAAFGQTAPQLCQGLQQVLHSRAVCIPKGMFGPSNGSAGGSCNDNSSINGSSMKQGEEPERGSEVGRMVPQGLPVKPASRVSSRQGHAGLLF